MTETCDLLRSDPVKISSTTRIAGPCASGYTPDSPSSESRFDNRVVPLIRKLCGMLDEQKIVYCQWKSNRKIHRWARGEGDLDLLLDRSAAGKFVAVLTKLGFKQAEASWGRRIPGVFHFYGFDQEAGKFVHVHAYYQLVIGKSYLIPVEKALLKSAIRGNLFYASSPEFELVIFVLRIVLAHSLLYSILRKIFGGTRDSVLGDELRHLESEVDQASLAAALEEHFPFIDARFFNECRQSLAPGYAAWGRVTLGRRLRRRLRAYGRKPQSIERLLAAVRQLMRPLQSRIFKTPSRKQFTSGGAIIALVGGDGSGKSTCVSSIYDWISSKFYVKKIHLGKPPRSLMTWAIICLHKTHRLFRNWKGKPDNPRIERLATYIRLLRWLSIARDRYRLYVKARRFASAGRIVICDRYPTPRIRLMDCPRIRRSLKGLSKNRLMNLLMETEESYYRKIMSPDLMIVLRVNPSIAVSRKANEDASHVRIRSEELWEANWRGSDVQLVDASRPLEHVLSEIKGLIWSSL